MCGICGVFHRDGSGVSQTTLKKMNDAISHRGPDGEGFFINENVGLAHRRLSIIDLSEAGTQPMTTPDRRFVITYNGEVYNYKELRMRLEDRGYRFRSSTDTEVVLAAWAEWGPESVRFLNGMFAFAVFDVQENAVFLVRDRFGVKPLYYSLDSELLIFGSEQRAILASGSIRRKVNENALIEYLTFQNILTDQTLIEGIKILPPGHILKVSAAKSSLHKYWDYQFQEPKGGVDENEYREELDRLLCQSVQRQLVSDVEIGAYLSGGMDSGTLTALAARQLPYIKTFTCGFDLSSASGLELGFDERVRAEAMSALFQTEHYEIVLKSGDMQRSLRSVASAIEEPRVGQSYPNYYVAQLASKFVKVVLSGAGGDELFGGYPWRYYRAAVASSFDDFVNRYFQFWQRLVPAENMPDLLRPCSASLQHTDTHSIFRDVFLNHRNELSSPADYINHSLYFEAKTFLHGLLVVEDKLSMRHGLETRVPFLDNDLVNFAMECPVSLKVRNLDQIHRIDENVVGDKKNFFFQQTNDGKSILRDVMSRYIPKSITDAKKQGFSSPDSSWFRGESIEFVRSVVSNKSAPLFEFLDFGTVNRLVADHLDGSKNRRLFIWSILSLNWYLEEILT
jgi:asparagine synthase (glutamine-hydrolysing)